MIRPCPRALAALLLLASLPAAAAVGDFVWDALPALPPAPGQARQAGLASAFVGVHRGVLLVAGGANFPERMPWDGGAKVWWDDVFVLESGPDGPARWRTDPAFRLPRRLAYGVSVSTPDGVVCAGGSDAERCYAEVFLLAWDAPAGAVRTVSLPPMPQPLANMAGALLGHTLYVAGGQHATKNASAAALFWALDLSQRDRPGAWKWQVLPAWPGPPRILPVAAAQRTPQGAAFFLFGGRVPHAGSATELLTDAYAYDPAARRWRTLPPVGGGKGVSVMAATAAPVGDDRILIFGGDRGELFLELEAHDRAIEAARAELSTAAGAAPRAALERRIAERLAAKSAIYAAHPGFSREVLAYDTRRDAWRVAARAPETVALPVTTTAVTWGDAIVIPSGEIRPGVRTSAVIAVRPAGGG